MVHQPSEAVQLPGSHSALHTPRVCRLLSNGLMRGVCGVYYYTHCLSRSPCQIIIFVRQRVGAHENPPSPLFFVRERGELPDASALARTKNLPFPFLESGGELPDASVLARAKNLPFSLRASGGELLDASQQAEWRVPLAMEGWEETEDARCWPAELKAAHERQRRAACPPQIYRTSWARTLCWRARRGSLC